MKILLAAKVELRGKERAILAGYRPTVRFGDVKMLCNFDSVHPSPLKPSDVGLVKLRVWQDAAGPSLTAGAKFRIFEGERDVGYGTVTEVL